MKILKQLSGILLIVLFAASCRKEEALGDIGPVPGLGGDTWVKGPIDSFIYTNLTLPFNIDVKYKWNQFTVNQINKNVVPLDEKYIIPALQSTVLNVWAAPYIAEKDILFLKQFAPKYFVLAGSAAYNEDGSATLGVAGGGRQITLFQLNYFRPNSVVGHVPSDTIVQKVAYLTIHHEFSHIFDQTRQRPDEFNTVTASAYSSDWINISDAQAREKGCITAYASSQAGEDWAEMISQMLVNGDTRFADIVNSISNPDARDAIWKKRDIIAAYLKDTWNIDFVSLQARVRAAVEAEF
jgi:substrate import-associated zinc metallohydrolase lipoprotein